jgi:prepilin-type processing-associated H-X9-DG protein
MAEWTDEATSYINNYLAQVGELAAAQGVEVNEFVRKLRIHISKNLKPNADGVVDMDALSAALAHIGTPEQVVNAGNSFETSTSKSPPPHQRDKKKSSTSGCLIAAIVVPAVCFFMIFVVGILAAILLPALARAREAARQATCANSLRQIAFNLNAYADANEGTFPALSNEPGRLMFNGTDVFDDHQDPEHQPVHSWFVCPSDEFGPVFKYTGSTLEVKMTIDQGTVQEFTTDNLVETVVDDHSYYYLSHVVRNDREGQMYIEEYDKAVRAGNGFDHAFGDLPRLTSSDNQEASKIPVMIEKLGHHIPGGGNVLYLDGHIEFVPRGVFPMTDQFFANLNTIDR